MKILNCHLASIQDTGRIGFRNWGIAQSGVMDYLSYSIGQILVGNENNEAVIEISGGVFEFQSLTSHLIALTGYGYSLSINGKPFKNWQPIITQENDIISITPQYRGFAYLNIHGGIKEESWLGSRSFYSVTSSLNLPISWLKKNALLSTTRFLTKKGQGIKNFISQQSPALKPPYPSDKLNRFDNSVIRFIKSNQFEKFQFNGSTPISDIPFIISNQINRMGYNLSCSIPIKYAGLEMLSSAVLPGTIQIPGNGQPIVLMADAQTTGGYPIIGQICQADLFVFAQKKPGDVVYFTLISLEEAEKSYLALQKSIIQFKSDFSLIMNLENE